MPDKRKITRSEYHQVAGLLMLHAYHSERREEIKIALASVLKIDLGYISVAGRSATTEEFLEQFDIEPEPAA